MTNEPIQLHRGKEFHKKMQDDWLGTAEGQILIEKAITKPTGRKARMKQIEDMFEQEGIPVVWQDETIEERKARSET